MVCFLCRLVPSASQLFLRPWLTESQMGLLASLVPAGLKDSTKDYVRPPCKYCSSKSPCVSEAQPLGIHCDLPEHIENHWYSPVPLDLKNFSIQPPPVWPTPHVFRWYATLTSKPPEDGETHQSLKQFALNSDVLLSRPRVHIYSSTLTCEAHWRISWLVQAGKGRPLRWLSDLRQDDHPSPFCPQLTVPWPSSVLGLSQVKQRSWVPSSMTACVPPPSASRGLKKFGTKEVDPIGAPGSYSFHLKFSVSNRREIKQLKGN